jgi:hypothetical protein
MTLISSASRMDRLTSWAHRFRSRGHARAPAWVSDRRYQVRDAVPKLRSQLCQSFLLSAVISQLISVVFDGIVQQRGADHVGVAHAVVGDDADSDPQ